MSKNTLTLNPTVETFQLGDHTVTLETGKIARQATGSVVISCCDTVVLVTCVGKSSADEGRDFFPLTVDYREKTSAKGAFPGGFFKREGRPSERETLTSRLIDRPLRPLFPKGFNNEVQIIAQVMSYDPAFDSDILALIGSSAAVALTGMPFAGPVGAVRVGYKDGSYLLNPNMEQLEHSKLDLVVAGTDKAVLMVESEAKELSEKEMLGAVSFGHEAMQSAITAIKSLVSKAGKPAWDWQPPAVDEALKSSVEAECKQAVSDAYLIQDKQSRYEALSVARDKAVEKFCDDSENAPTKDQVCAFFSGIESATVRNRVLAGEPRIDGRDTTTVRPIAVETGVLPRTHGSALFTRGETQAIVTVTLGTDRDAQLIEDLQGARNDSFMLHYNFPPFSVGECGFIGSPKRREIGHGKLAKRGLQAVLPSEEEFPYVLRVVSDITESNGSSSMATVCGGSLALMDAGVPLKAPVAGIAMGLVMDEHSGKYAVLSDILGDEDHLGDMDFKVAGTEQGILALQMDIKINGITFEIMEKALEQAKAGRLHILDIMSGELTHARENLASNAPRFITFSINPEKIRDVIGKGGATIRGITESTGVTIDISDDGLIKIASADESAASDARSQIEDIIAEVEVGQVYTGKIVKLLEFGAFVNLLPGRDGFLHISQISKERVNDINDVLSEGQEVKVKVVEIDRQNRVRLSVRVFEEEGETTK